MMQIINDAINHSNNSIPCIKTVVQYENIATPFWGKNYTGPSSSMETIEKQALGVVLKKGCSKLLKILPRNHLQWSFFSTKWFTSNRTLRF